MVSYPLMCHNLHHTDYGRECKKRAGFLREMAGADRCRGHFGGRHLGHAGIGYAEPNSSADCPNHRRRRSIGVVPGERRGKHPRPIRIGSSDLPGGACVFDYQILEAERQSRESPAPGKGQQAWVFTLRGPSAYSASIGGASILYTSAYSASVDGASACDPNGAGSGRLGRSCCATAGTRSSPACRSIEAEPGAAPTSSETS